MLNLPRCSCQRQTERRTSMRFLAEQEAEAWVDGRVLVDFLGILFCPISFDRDFLLIPICFAISATYQPRPGLIDTCFLQNVTRMILTEYHIIDKEKFPDNL